MVAVVDEVLSCCSDEGLGAFDVKIVNKLSTYVVVLFAWEKLWYMYLTSMSGTIRHRMMITSTRSSESRCDRSEYGPGS